MPVPTPEMSSGSLPEWIIRPPRSRARSSQYTRASSKSRPCRITSAPSPRIEATFTGFAPSGAQIVACTPNSRAAYAIDWPWFPVDAPNTPRSRSARPSCATRLTPPRTLNAPTG